MLTVKKSAAIIAGSLFIAIGINFYLIPFRVLDGGIIGIALIIKYLWGMKVGLTIIVCSVPIFALAWFRYRSFFYNSVHGMLISSIMIDLLYPFHYHFQYYIRLSPLSSSIIGGLSVGTGIGIMLRNKTSTGGTDLLAQFLADVFSMNVGVAVFIIDAIVVSFGGLLLSAETFFLSIASIAAGGLATSLFTLQGH